MQKVKLLKSKKVKVFLLFYLFTFLPLSLSAQRLKKPCDRRTTQAGTRAGAQTRSIDQWKGGTYRVPVVLCEFPDQGFKRSASETVAAWEARLNEKGFSERGANGCVAEYFEKQSGGLFKPTFDILTPVVLPNSMAYYGANDKDGQDVRPDEMVDDACAATGADFSPYDWDGDGRVDAVVVIYAGMSENKSENENAIWPHTWETTGKVGSLRLSTYACVSELGDDGDYDGYATFCHEFSHCLGLPDLYPISGSVYSIFDEWDLMDGGNYTNHGFSPPNYSAYERYLCGWMELEELTDAASISGLPAWDTNPKAYVIRNDANARDFYVLENRQQTGWDALIPGQGLLVTHVKNYNPGDLGPNTSTKVAIDLVVADNRKYHESLNYFGEPMYDENGRNRYLSLAAYPYHEGSLSNTELSDSSTPAMTFSGKPVTNIQMDAQGQISFDFMKSSTGIISIDSDAKPGVWYDLYGRQLPGVPSSPGIYLFKGKKVKK